MTVRAPGGEDRSRLADWIGRFVGLAFVGVAGAVAVQMAWAQGSDPVRQWTMVAVVTAGLALLAFGPALTIGRGRVLAGLLLLPVWALVIAYNASSALEYFDRYLADHAARERLAGDLFRVERAELVRLQRARDAVRTDRAAAVVEAELARPRLTADQRARLEAELADARERDRTEDRIREVAARLSGATARAAGEGAAQLAPLLAWLTARTGVTVASNADLRALLLLAMTEMGAALVPLGMALSNGRRRRLLVWRRPSAEPAPASAGPAGAPAPSAHPPEDVERVRLWLDTRCVRKDGARVRAADLHADYCRWVKARGAREISGARFGAILGDLGLARRKAGRAWVVHYIGLQLRPSGQGAGPGAVVRLAVHGQRGA